MEISDNERRAKDLREHEDYLRLRMVASAGVCVLTDFDGTIVELEARPDVPRLRGKARRVLDGLRRCGNVTLGVVSGRALADLLPRVGLPGIWYVGNHGYEIRNPRGEERRFYEPEDVRYLEQIQEEMRRGPAKIPGVLLEHKGPVLAVHYRGVEEARVSQVEKGFLSVLERHRTRVMMSRGHAVLEARLKGGVNKGRAVGQIRRELPAGTLVLYFGDDVTDRDAFRELRGVGISVEVGGTESSIADFTLPDPKAVLGILGMIPSVLKATQESRPRRSFGRRGGC